jgi:hypothetical protein
MINYVFKKRGYYQINNKRGFTTIHFLRSYCFGGFSIVRLVVRRLLIAETRVLWIVIAAVLYTNSAVILKVENGPVRGRRFKTDDVTPP